jgi:hypothetical protein
MEGTIGRSRVKVCTTIIKHPAELSADVTPALKKNVIALGLNVR